MKMSEATKLLTTSISIEKNLISLGDIKQSFNILWVKDKDGSIGDLTLVWKFECFEMDLLTSQTIWRVLPEIGKF